MPLRIKCPDCGGSGETLVSYNCGPDWRKHYSEMSRCRRCKGAGTISRKELRWIRLGKKLRALRLNNRWTLRDVAIVFRVDVCEYSAAENGYVDPRPLLTGVKRMLRK